MVIRFLKSMWKWAISGFQTVDSELEDKSEVILETIKKQKKTYAKKNTY